MITGNTFVWFPVNTRVFHKKLARVLLGLTVNNSMNRFPSCMAKDGFHSTEIWIYSFCLMSFNTWTTGCKYFPAWKDFRTLSLLSLNSLFIITWAFWRGSVFLFTMIFWSHCILFFSSSSQRRVWGFSLICLILNCLNTSYLFPLKVLKKIHHNHSL